MEKKTFVIETPLDNGGGVEVILDQILRHTREMLMEDWYEIQTIREDDLDEKIKLTLAHLIRCKGDQEVLRTTLTYGMRKKHMRESVLNPNQPALM